MAAKPPSLYRGDTWRREWRLTSASGAPIDLTGASARLHLRNEAGERIAEANTANGRIVIDGPAGKLIMVIPAVETRALAVARHKFDLEVTHADGTVKTYEASTLAVLEDMSHD